MGRAATFLLFFMASQATGETLGQVSEKLQINCKNPPAVSVPEKVETFEEKAARAERDFHNALMFMDKCINMVAQGAAAAGGGGTGAGAGAGASGGLQGTDSPGSGTQASEPQTADTTDSQETPSSETESSQQNGVAPKDIPSGKNDDIVAQQLRELAEKETDPVLRKKYWNQYRKYKGLDPVD